MTGNLHWSAICFTMQSFYIRTRKGRWRWTAGWKAGMALWIILCFWTGWWLRGNRGSPLMWHIGISLQITEVLSWRTRRDMRNIPGIWLWGHPSQTWLWFWWMWQKACRDRPAGISAFVIWWESGTLYLRWIKWTWCTMIRNILMKWCWRLRKSLQDSRWRVPAAFLYLPRRGIISMIPLCGWAGMRENPFWLIWNRWMCHLGRRKKQDL